MVDYYSATKGIQIARPDLPGIRIGKRKEVFPLQVCRVLPLQRLPLLKMTGPTVKELLNANSPHPDDRYNNIRSQLREVGTGQCEVFMLPFGVRLLGADNEVQIKMRQPPGIRFGNNRMAMVRMV